MASNTQILIRRSLASAAPTSLLQGELAYSYSSNTLYIGTPGSDGALEIGAWSDLTNLISGTYGSTTEVPVITVDAHGKVTNVTTQAISTNISLSGDDSTFNTMSLLTGTLNFNGGQGITTAVLDDTANVTFNVDDTVLRSNTSDVGSQVINTDVTIGGAANNNLTVTGNLYVFGNTTTFNIDQFEIQDPLLLLGTGNYYSDTFDIGFASHYNDGQNAHTGLIRDAGTKEYHFFKGYTGELDANNNINLSDSSYREANVHAEYFKGNLIADTAVANGFYGTQDTNLMYLYPSETYKSTDQYIIVDPTTPNHIHLRAGGNIDGSTAELYLGGENTGVVVIDATETTGISAGGNTWIFNPDSSITFPAFGVDLHNGNLQTGRVLQFGDANYQAIITGPTPVGTNQSAQRLIIQGQRGNGTGEGGDVYVWGGDSNNNGGDIKIYAGDSDGISSGSGGYINIDGGYGYNNGGIVEITGGQSTLLGGDVNLVAGQASDPNGTDGQIKISANNYNWYFTRDGRITLPNNNQIYDNATSIFVETVRSDASPTEILFYNDTTKEVTRGTLQDLNTDSLANGTSELLLFATGEAYLSNTDSGKFLVNTADNGAGGKGTIGGGYTFYGDGAYDTGMFSEGDGELNFFVNTELAHSANTVGVYLYKDLTLTNGAVIKDTAGDAVAFGQNAGTISQGNLAVAIGDSAGYNTQGAYSVAIGSSAGNVTQSDYAVAIGPGAGQTTQGWGATAIGTNAGYDNQGTVATALGSNAGRYTQGYSAVALGRRAGETSQGQYAIAMGNRAGQNTQGEYSIAIGALAGQTSQGNNSIIFNASGSTLDTANSGFYVNPVRYEATQDAVDDGFVYYNQTTKEFRYSYQLDGGSF